MSDIDKLIEYIKDSKNIVFFGGAGVSTESGVLDFRSKDGLYNNRDVNFAQYTPEYLLSHSCLRDNPKVFYEFYRQKLDARNINPNVTHNVLAKMEKNNKLDAIITQNIDGLHQKAGSKKVYEIHGTTFRNYCERCHRGYPNDYIFTSKEDIPICEKCGGKIRPDVTLYEESLPEDAVRASIEAIRNADMLIIGGTSLVVYPAASYIEYFRGEHLVVINKDPIKVQLREGKDIFLQESLGKVFGKIDKELAL